MAKLKCVAHNRRVFVNGDSGSVRHRSDLGNCDSLMLTPGTGSITLPRAAIIWLCDPTMPAHYRNNPELIEEMYR